MSSLPSNAKLVSEELNRSRTGSASSEGTFDGPLGGPVVGDVEKQSNATLDLPKTEVSPDRKLAQDGTKVIVVDWEGEQDVRNPKNWSNRARMGATLVVASFTFLSPLSSTMIAPASFQVAQRFGMTNEVEISMITSIFVLAYAVSPLVLGPLSELYGRVIVLQSANVFYILFNLLCGLATSKTQLLVFRFLSGLGGGAPLAIGAGVLSDLWRNEERGKAAALYSLGPLLGPALGPIMGAWIAEKLPNNGYVWVFYSTTIFSALVQLIGLVYLRETYAPTLLHRQALVLKKSMGLPPDSDHVQTIYEARAPRRTVRQVIAHGLVRPFVMFWQESIIQILALYMSIIYGVVFLLTVTTTPIYTEVYGESVGIAGLHFIASGLGYLVWGQIQGRLLDFVYRKLKIRYNSKGEPEFRLPMMVPASIFLPFGLLLYGWSAEKHLPWIAVDIGFFFISAGLIGVFQTINVYLIDTFTLHAASALASASSLRSLFGFAFPLFAPYLFSSLGYGVGCTILAVIAIVVGVPAAPLLFIYGKRIRENSKYAARKE